MITLNSAESAKRRTLANNQQQSRGERHGFCFWVICALPPAQIGTQRRQGRRVGAALLMLIQEDVQGGFATWKNSKLKRQPRNVMKNFGKKTSEDYKERLNFWKIGFSGDSSLPHSRAALCSQFRSRMMSRCWRRCVAQIFFHLRRRNRHLTRCSKLWNGKIQIVGYTS